MPEITRTLAALIDQVDSRSMRRLQRTWKDDSIPITRRPSMKRYLLHSDRVSWYNLLPVLRVEQLRSACQSLRAPYGGPRDDLEASLRIEASIDELGLKPFSRKGIRLRKYLWECAFDDEVPLEEMIAGMDRVLEGDEEAALPTNRSPSPPKETPQPRYATTGFSALAGMDWLKAQLQDEVIGPYRQPKRYRRYGLSLPNGVLFHGPPGCGKSYVAERLSEELKLNFIRVLPSTVGSALIHETASRIAGLFDQALQEEPAMLFFDELDALAPARANLDCHSEHKAEEVNELLARIEGAGEKGILVIGATNLKSHLDPALLRPGRFDRHIHIGPPDAPARKAILAHYLAYRPTKALDLSPIVKRTEGHTPADLKALVNQAALLALKQDAPITTWHLEQVVRKQGRLV